MAISSKVEGLFDLSSQVALVTGASQGIGLVSAELLAAAGATIVAVARREERLHQAAEELRSHGHNVRALPADVSDPDQVRDMLKRAAGEFGRIDILVNNAGISAAGPIDELDIEDWDELLNINLRGAFLCSKAVTPVMRERGNGVVVNMASISGQTGGMSASLHYASSKGGLIAFTRALAKQMAPWGRPTRSLPARSTPRWSPATPSRSASSSK